MNGSLAQKSKNQTSVLSFFTKKEGLPKTSYDPTASESQNELHPPLPNHGSSTSGSLFAQCLFPLTAESNQPANNLLAPRQTHLQQT